MPLAWDIVGYISLVVLGIVPIVNPFSTAPTFIAMTSDATKSERRQVATLACVYMALLLIVFLLLGTLILQFFGITLKSLRFAGGLIIAYMGFRMLFPGDHPRTGRDNQPDTNPLSLAFMPLAMPMLAGPGSISVVLAMATQVSQVEGTVEKVGGYLVVSAGIVISAVICWAVLWGSGAVVRFLGKNGIEAMTKLMGFLLVCIGVEFVLSGWAMS